MNGKRLYKSDVDRKVSGVCGGIGEYFNIDPSIIRLGWLILIIFSFGTGLFVYFAAALILPKKNDDTQ